MKLTKITKINLAIKELTDEEQNYINDGYHTFAELYEFRKLYNAMTFNSWSKEGLYSVHKSKKHYDGKDCFDGGWFIVIAILPTGQISNHYKLEDWDLFKCTPTEEALFDFDGHTGQDVLNRLKDVVLNNTKHILSNTERNVNSRNKETYSKGLYS